MEYVDHRSGITGQSVIAGRRRRSGTRWRGGTKERVCGGRQVIAGEVEEEEDDDEEEEEYEDEEEDDDKEGGSREWKTIDHQQQQQEQQQQVKEGEDIESGLLDNQTTNKKEEMINIMERMMITTKRTTTTTTDRDDRNKVVNTLDEFYTENNNNNNNCTTKENNNYNNGKKIDIQISTNDLDDLMQLQTNEISPLPGMERHEDYDANNNDEEEHVREKQQQDYANRTKHLVLQAIHEDDLHHHNHPERSQQLRNTNNNLGYLRLGPVGKVNESRTNATELDEHPAKEDMFPANSMIDKINNRAQSINTRGFSTNLQMGRSIQIHPQHHHPSESGRFKNMQVQQHPLYMNTAPISQKTQKHRPASVFSSSSVPLSLQSPDSPYFGHLRDDCHNAQSEFYEENKLGRTSVIERPYALDPQAHNAASPDALNAMNHSYTYNITNKAPNRTSRTIYCNNLPNGISYGQLLTQLRFGPVDSITIVRENQCAYIDFLYPASLTRIPAGHVISLNGNQIMLTHGESVHVQPEIMEAVKRGASRAMYITTPDSYGLLSSITTSAVTTRLVDQTLDQDAIVETEAQAYFAEGTRAYISNEEILIVAETRSLCEQFGLVEDIKLIRNKNLVLVHFTSIAACIRAVTALSVATAYQYGHSNLPGQSFASVMPRGCNRNPWSVDRKVQFAKDRCAITQDDHRGSILEDSTMAFRRANSNSSSYDNSTSDTAVFGSENNTVYLGGLHPETTCEEICNAVRGGVIYNLKYMDDKNCCFVTFIQASAAYAFHTRSLMQGLVIKSRRLKVGWGKPMPIPEEVFIYLARGASRNVYIGNIDETVTEERLHKDFSEFGRIEKVDVVRDKSMAFVNFTSFVRAVRAVEGMRGREGWARYKINFGKDRCGNAPKAIGDTGISSPISRLGITSSHEPSIANMYSSHSIFSMASKYGDRNSQGYGQDHGGLITPPADERPGQDDHASKLGFLDMLRTQSVEAQLVARVRDSFRVCDSP